MESPKWRSEEGKETTTDRKEKEIDRASSKCTNQGKTAVVQREPIVALVYQG
jgi:hypothetical protein